MKIVFLIILLITVFIFVLLFAETKVEILYKDKKLCLVIRNVFLKVKITPKMDRKENKLSEKNQEQSEAEKKIDNIREKYREYKEIIKIFLKTMRYRIKINMLKINLDYGTGSAATTGILYGVIWGMVTGAYNTLSMFFDLEFPDVLISPDFHNSKFDFSFNGILRVRLVHIIKVLYKIYIRDKKIKQKGAKENA